MTQSNDHSVQERLTNLESKLAFLEHSVDKLSGELATQQQETRRVLKQLQQVHELIQSLQRDGGVSDGHDEVPPHY